MTPLILSPARWGRNYLSGVAEALALFHSEFATELSTLPVDFGGRVPVLLKRIPEEYRDLWSKCAAKEWLWQMAVAGANIPLPPDSPLLQVRLFGEENPTLSMLANRRAAVAVIPLGNSEGPPRTLRLWCFSKSGDLPSDSQQALPGLEGLRLQPGDRIYCDDFPTRLTGQSWQLGAALAFRMLREPDRRHAIYLGQQWIVSGDINTEGRIVRVEPGNKLELLKTQEWTSKRNWMWPASNRDELVLRFHPHEPAYFVETIEGAWARLALRDDQPEKNPEICRKLLDHGFRLAGSDANHNGNRALDLLSFELADNYPAYEGLLASMRRDLQQGSLEFRYDATRCGRIQEVKRMCQKLKFNFLLEDFHWESDRKLCGRVTGRPGVKRFLLGGWLERCVRIIVENFLNLQPARIGCLQNACGQRPDGCTFELDTLLQVDDDLYWIESKSGGYTEEHLLRYKEIQRLLDLPAGRLIVVAGNVEEVGSRAAVEKNFGLRLLTPQELEIFIEELEARYRAKECAR